MFLKTKLRFFFEFLNIFRIFSKLTFLQKNVFAGSFRSHVCFGQPGNGQNATPISKFICPVCKTDELHSFIEFQRHIRQTHNNCDVCFESCNSQEELSQVIQNYLIFINTSNLRGFIGIKFDYRKKDNSIVRMSRIS